MNIPLMLSNTGSVRVVAHPTRPDANEIVIGDGLASVTLATNVPDSVALLFARAYDTARKASSMHGELTDIVRDVTTPEPLCGRISGLLQELYGAPRAACSVHGQYHPCGKCAEDYQKEKASASTAHGGQRHPSGFGVDSMTEALKLAASLPYDRDTERALCEADNATRQPQKTVETYAREQGWRPVSEPPSHVAPYDYEEGARCVVVWINAENTSDLDCELSTIALVRRGDYADDGRKLRGAWWRPLMDAPPAAEWACQGWKPFGADRP